MFGESTSPGSIGPSRRGLWVGAALGCLLLATGVVLVSRSADGLNFFGRPLADTTPTFSGAPKDDESRNPQRVERADSLIASRPQAPAARAAAVESKPAPAPPVAVADPTPAPTTTPTTTPTPAPTPIDPRSTPAPAMASADPTPTPVAPPETPVCTRPGYAVVLEPAADPISTALARALRSSELQPRIIQAASREFGREDIDRIMAGDGSFVAGRIDEGTLLVAQLRVHVQRTVIAYGAMADVRGTMDLAIVRNTCGTMTVQRHRDVFGRSVNQTISGGTQGLGEVFKEKIADLVSRRAW